MGRRRSPQDLVGHSKEWPVGLVHLNKVGSLIATIWMEGNIPRNTNTEHSNIQFLVSPGVGTVESYTQCLAGLTGKVKWEDEGERRGSVAERPAEMSAPRLRTTREKS